MLLSISLYLLLVIVLPLALSAVVSYRTLPEGEACPLCRRDTLPVLARWLNAVARVSRRKSLQKRWCPSCGWEGVVRAAGGVRPAPLRQDISETWSSARTLRSSLTSAVGARPVGDAPHLDASFDAVPAREAINLRSLELAGRPWRVLLQYWRDELGWHGRLLFIAPSGRLWADRMEPFTGRSRDDLVGQALALPDLMLACRLRDLILD